MESMGAPTFRKDGKCRFGGMICDDGFDCRSCTVPAEYRINELMTEIKELKSRLAGLFVRTGF